MRLLLRIIICLVMLPGAVARLSAAGRFEFEFRNVPLPEALQRVAGVDKAN